jgi:hypothetical protein
MITGLRKFANDECKHLDPEGICFIKFASVKNGLVTSEIGPDDDPVSVFQINMYTHYKSPKYVYCVMDHDGYIIIDYVHETFLPKLDIKLSDFDREVLEEARDRVICQI